MGIFKKKNKYDIFQEEKKKSGCRKNALPFLIIFIILIINMSIYIIKFDTTSYEDLMNEYKYMNLTENDLDLICPASQTNEELLKLKFYNSNLHKLSNEINAVNINSTTNMPTQDLNLNFNEITYLLDIVISFTTSFNIIEIYWTISEDILNINAIYKYSTFLPDDNAKIYSFYIKHAFEYNINTQESKDTFMKVLNFPNLSPIQIENSLLELKLVIINALFETKAQEIRDENSEEDNVTEKTNKPLCEMLGFKSLEIFESGIHYLV